MARLPDTENAPLVRTDFSDDQSWRAIKSAAAHHYGDFQANITIVEDPAFKGLTLKDVPALGGHTTRHAILLLADTTAMKGGDHAILCVDLLSQSLWSFRVIPSQLWSVENNLSLGNMDFKDFMEAADASGVFRGFPN